MNDIMIGRRVKVWLKDYQILGNIAAVQGSQIVLNNVLSIGLPGIDAILIDTSSGMFSHLAFLQSNLVDADPEIDAFVKAAALAKNGIVERREHDAFELSGMRSTFSLEASSDLPYDQSVLNPLENELFRQHPIDGLNACLCARAAISRSQARYQAACLHNGNGDAFRHALWNAMMAKRIGVAMAKRWGDAHEDGASPPPPAMEREMDLFNNEVGRGIALSTTDDPVASDTVQAQVRAGGMKRIVNSQLVMTDSGCEQG